MLFRIVTPDHWPPDRAFEIQTFSPDRDGVSQPRGVRAVYNRSNETFPPGLWLDVTQDRTTGEYRLVVDEPEPVAAEPEPSTALSLDADAPIPPPAAD